MSITSVSNIIFGNNIAANVATTKRILGSTSIGAVKCQCLCSSQDAFTLTSSGEIVCFLPFLSRRHSLKRE